MTDSIERMPVGEAKRFGRSLATLAVLSLFASVGLGLLDRESQGLVYLFTAEPGNLVALAMYTGGFCLLGLPFVFGWFALRRRV